MVEEIELKLAVSADQVRRLRRNPLIRSLATKRAVTSRLHSVYFDTPELLLSKHGMALRVRRIGDRRIQTLKQPIADPSGQTQHYHTERLMHLPDGFLCYRPPQDSPPIEPLPLSPTDHR